MSDKYALTIIFVGFVTWLALAGKLIPLFNLAVGKNND